MGYLDNVPEDKVFVLGSKKLLNIADLLAELKLISDEEYSHYASDKHNYFADWIMHVIKFDKLAADLINTGSNKKNAIRVLEKQIKKLKSDANPKKPVLKPIIEKPLEQEPSVNAEVKEITSEKEVSNDDDQLIKDVLESTSIADVEKHEYKEKEVVETISNEEPDSSPNLRSGHSIHEIEDILMKLSKEDVEIRNVIWKHFKWELAKEFMYGMAMGIFMGFILSKLFMP